jgi:hypothetical protein
VSARAGEERWGASEQRACTHGRGRSRAADFLHGIRFIRTSVVVFLLSAFALYLCFHSMHTLGSLVSHEGHPLTHAPRVGRNGQFAGAIRDECGISGRGRDFIRLVITLWEEDQDVTFWSSGRSPRRKRTVSYSSARDGGVRRESRATARCEEEKKDVRALRLAGCWMSLGV